MTFEITLDMEALGEDDTILVRDEFGEHTDREYVPKSMYDQLKDESAKIRELVQYILDESYGDDWFAMKAEELGFEANY